MLTFPNAKINLGLHVTSKRTDGYHDIETIFYPIKELSDILEIVPSKETSLLLSGLKIDGNIDSNLCIKAYHMLRKDFDLPPIKIYLHKIIPLGAGLGGGSSDAAFSLSAINKLFHLNLNNEDLKQYAAVLGSDCSFFIENSPSFAHGRGEILEPISLDLSLWKFIVVKPNIHVSTADAYSGVSPRKPTLDLRYLIQDSPESWKNRLVNDFEKSVFEKHPRIREIKEKLYKEGAIYASMSGSGSSVFGLFKEVPHLNFPDCFVWKQE